MYSYVKSTGKQKVNVKVPSLQTGDGTVTKNDQENSKILSDFFSSIFTKEPQDNDLQLLQEFENRCDDRLDNVEISGEIVREKLNNVKMKNRKARMGSTQGYWRGVNIV